MALTAFFIFSSNAFATESPSGTPSPSSSPLEVSANPTIVTPDYELSVLPAKVADGSVVTALVHFKKTLSGKPDITGTFEKQTSAFFEVPEKGPGVYEAFFGVEHGYKPGKAELKITGSGIQTSLPFEVVDGNYSSETLKVDGSRVNPPKKVMARIYSEIKEINKVYAIMTPQRYWSGAFQLPIDSKVTSPFGTNRLYNGQLKNFHGGLDLKAPEGTPIHATGAGVIVLAKNLYYSGNTVIIDHGFGLLTMYFHMSKFDVKLGDPVTTGQLLGLSGKTGRVTGPHLHWQVIVQKVKVNPTGLLEVGK